LPEEGGVVFTRWLAEPPHNTQLGSLA